MGISPQHVPSVGNMPFGPLGWDPSRPLSWDELLKLPGNNILKNLYYANRRWEAAKAHAAVTMQLQANQINEQAAAAEETTRARPRMDKPDIFGDGRDAEEVLLEMGIDPSSGPLDILVEEARAKKAVELLYTPDRESYSLTDALLSSLSRSLALIDAMKKPLDPAQMDSFKSLKDKILEELYKAHPDLAMQNWLATEYYAFQLAKGLIAMGHTSFPGDPAIYVNDFAKHMERLSTMSKKARSAVDASGAPGMELSFYQDPVTFVLPERGPDQSDQDWQYDVALRYIQDMCPHITTERTLPSEQKNQLLAQQNRHSPFQLTPEAPAREATAKEKLEYIAQDVLQVPLETLMTRAIQGVMQSFGLSFSQEIAGSDIENAENAENAKRKSPTPFAPPRPGKEDPYK